MKNLVRAAALSLLTIGAFATANATVIARPSFSPIPMCSPGTDCTKTQSGSFSPIPMCSPGTDCTKTQSGSFSPIPMCSPGTDCTKTQSGS